MWDVLSGMAEMAWNDMSGVTKTAWDVMSGVTKTAWDVMSRVTKTAWDVLSGVANLCGMFCPGCQKNGMGCFVRLPLILVLCEIYLEDQLYYANQIAY